MRFGPDVQCFYCAYCHKTRPLTALLAHCQKYEACKARDGFKLRGDAKYDSAAVLLSVRALSTLTTRADVLAASPPCVTSRR